MTDTVKSKNKLRSIRDLDVYKLAFDTAMEIYRISKSFPQEEKYSLTDQVRRSSRSVCTNLAEGWRKRRYIAMFINKLTDSSQEASETQTWLEFAYKCNYINQETFEKLDNRYEHIFAMLNNMEKKAESFCNINNEKKRPSSEFNGRPSSLVIN